MRGQMKLGYLVALLLSAVLLAVPASAKDCCDKRECGKSKCGCAKTDCGCEKVECDCSVKAKPKCPTDVELLPTPVQDGGVLLPNDCCERHPYKGCCDRDQFRLLCAKCGPADKCKCEKSDDCGCKVKDKCGCKPRCGKEKCGCKPKCGKSDCKCKKSDCGCKKSDCACGKH